MEDLVFTVEMMEWTIIGFFIFGALICCRYLIIPELIGGNRERIRPGESVIETAV